MLSRKGIKERLALYEPPPPEYIDIHRRKDAEYEALEAADQSATWLRSHTCCGSSGAFSEKDLACRRCPDHDICEWLEA